MGRLFLPPDKRRNLQIRVYLSPLDVALIDRKRGAQSRSDYIRDKALDMPRNPNKVKHKARQQRQKQATRKALT